MYLSVCISSRLPVTFSWWKTCLRYCLPQVITNHFLQVGQCMYVSVLRVCVCIVCICLYGMNEGCISFYCSGGHKNHRRVPKWPSPAAAPGGPDSGQPRSCAQTLFSSIPVHSDNPISRTPPLPPRRRSLNRPPRTAAWCSRPDPSLSTRSQAPPQPIGEVSSSPETYSVCHSPPKTPSDRDWRMHVCACMCMYCMYCMYMYVYVCIVCMCVYFTTGYKYPQISRSIRVRVGSVVDSGTCRSVDGCSRPRTV